MKYKFGICGAFDFNEQGTGGQSIKTREFYYALCNAIGKDNIRILESTEYKNNPVVFLLNYLKMLHSCEHTIIFPAQNGILFLAPLSAWFKRGKVHYSVIGGWLPKLVRANPFLKFFLIRLDTILVETNAMKDELELFGLNNVKRLLNFKRLVPVSESELHVHTPLRLCYFSRVTREKGIEDAIEAVRVINRNEIKCTFDIYGPIIPEYESIFDEILKDLPKEIKYCGKIAPEKSIETLNRYDVQLFPTRYPTEGIPGSIIDSYFAGVPVLSARWNSFEEVIKEGVTGIGFKQGDKNDLSKKLGWLLEHKSMIKAMKRNCLKEAEEYTPQKIMASFFDLIS